MRLFLLKWFINATHKSKTNHRRIHMATNQQIIINSLRLRDVFDVAMRIAKYPTTVLLEGESGVGKEVFANFIHQNSPRANMPYIKVNCASIPETLLESELFGYERGAFTGAKREGNPGLFELADKGTLLLDEVSELNHSMQAKLLRVLQDREVRRIGGSWSKVIDVRIIASTNQNLRELVLQRKFREDLYYRLNVAYLHIPPLRERQDDIPALLTHYIQQISSEFGISCNLSLEVTEVLKQYKFPGNVRELRNLIEGLCVSSEQGSISLNELPSYIIRLSNQETITDLSLSARTAHFEKQVIVQLLEKEKSIRRAAKKLNISHSTLIRKMQKYGITDSIT
jgi:TyrR family helix-turn-helix protein